MTMWMIIGISVLVYIIVGMATVAMCIMAEGDPAADQVVEVILFAVLAWPIVMREASREKPRVYSEDYEP